MARRSRDHKLAGIGYKSSMLAENGMHIWVIDKHNRLKINIDRLRKIVYKTSRYKRKNKSEYRTARPLELQFGDA